jgi:hypothetical protein
MTVNQEVLSTLAPPLPFLRMRANDNPTPMARELVGPVGEAGENPALQISIQNNPTSWPRVFPGL